jgi:hypothetical protein
LPKRYQKTHSAATVRRVILPACCVPATEAGSTMTEPSLYNFEATTRQPVACMIRCQSSASPSSPAAPFPSRHQRSRRPSGCHDKHQAAAECLLATSRATPPGRFPARTCPPRCPLISRERAGIMRAPHEALTPPTDAFYFSGHGSGFGVCSCLGCATTRWRTHHLNHCGCRAYGGLVIALRAPFNGMTDSMRPI